MISVIGVARFAAENRFGNFSTTRHAHLAEFQGATTRIVSETLQA